MGQRRCLYLFIIIGMSQVFPSCSPVYFPQPQPIDAENEYKFPVSLRGSYTFNHGFGIVSKHSYVEFEIHPFNFDTTDSILFEQITETSFQSPERSLKVREGSLLVHRISSKSFEFDQDNLLRKVSKNVYVLNRRDSILWEVNPLVKKSPRELEVLFLSDDNIHYSYGSYLNGKFYINVAFTKEELLQRINEGLFDSFQSYYRTKKRYTPYWKLVEDKGINMEDSDEME